VADTSYTSTAQGSTSRLSAAVVFSRSSVPGIVLLALASVATVGRGFLLPAGSFRIGLSCYRLESYSFICCLSTINIDVEKLVTFCFVPN
jgi:hypothetical protein